MPTHDYFQRAFRRGAQTRAGIPGTLVRGSDGNCAMFWLVAPAGTISAVEYRCTTCVTLLAFCQHLAELAIGMPVEMALLHTPEQLLAMHPDVPQYKADRATLASEAFRSAAHQIAQGELS